ncbi:hypothetical protein KM043_012559 [Ampulex compressa]|nr:hypothetical protein KM043_012559 [Ampulex compressa]
MCSAMPEAPAEATMERRQVGTPGLRSLESRAAHEFVRRVDGKEAERARVWGAPATETVQARPKLEEVEEAEAKVDESGRCLGGSVSSSIIPRTRKAGPNAVSSTGVKLDGEGRARGEWKGRYAIPISAFEPGSMVPPMVRRHRRPLAAAR